MRELVIVNASPVLSDADVQAVIAPLQLQIDRDFLPVWEAVVEPRHVSFASADDISQLPPDCEPIFLNKHSTDDSALGWHDFHGSQAFSRCFVGDCLRAGLDWRVTLSHEALELILNPTIKKVWRMQDGRLAAFEACDAVEADELAIDFGDGMKMSNFVLPSYYNNTGNGPFDFGHVLTGPCPTLTHGGYLPVTNRYGQWSQVQMDRPDGLAGRRALSRGFRRQARGRVNFADLEIVDPATM
jgi:hypothetical protein